MRLEPSEPKNESDFFQGLRGRTGTGIFYERVEPSNESGFPDIHFVLRDNVASIVHPNEGTIELKYDKRKKPNLKTLLRGTQQSALLDYYEAGGRRRFALCYCNGITYLWNTLDYYHAVRGSENNWTSERRWVTKDEYPLDFLWWISEELKKKEWQ